MICRKWVDNQMRGLTEMPGLNKELRDPHCTQVTARASTLDVCPAVLWGAQATWGAQCGHCFLWEPVEP